MEGRHVLWGVASQKNILNYEDCVSRDKTGQLGQVTPSPFKQQQQQQQQQQQEKP